MKKKGYWGRYLRYACKKHRQTLFLAGIFLMGSIFGCLLAEQTPQILSQLSQRLSFTQSSDFFYAVSRSFAADALLLAVFFLCGLGSIFQLPVLALLFLKGFGFGVLGIYCYSMGDSSHTLYYLCALLPQAIAEALLLIKSAEESLLFSVRFWNCLCEKETVCEQNSSFGSYLAKFVLLYLLFGSICFCGEILKNIFSI